MGLMGVAVRSLRGQGLLCSSLLAFAIFSGFCSNSAIPHSIVLEVVSVPVTRIS